LAEQRIPNPQVECSSHSRRVLKEDNHEIRLGNIEPVFISAAVTIVVMLTCGSIGYYLIGRKPRMVDFMIATEGEMKKVNWSTRREIFGSTILVILLTAFIALLCQLADLSFSAFFQYVDVLQSS
jgi:preprotein translocase SecE subunit